MKLSFIAPVYENYRIVANKKLELNKADSFPNTHKKPKQ